MAHTQRRRVVPEDMRAILERIEEWRRTRTGRTHMPKDLWGEAIAAARVHGVYKTSEILRVNYDSLRAKTGPGPSPGVPRTMQPREPPAAGFVEVPHPVPDAPLAGVLIEIAARDGTRLTIRVPTVAALDVPDLVRAFRSGDRP